MIYTTVSRTSILAKNPIEPELQWFQKGARGEAFVLGYALNPLIC